MRHRITDFTTEPSSFLESTGADRVVHSHLILYSLSYVAGRVTVSIRSNLSADGQMLTPLIGVSR